MSSNSFSVESGSVKLLPDNTEAEINTRPRLSNYALFCTTMSTILTALKNFIMFIPLIVNGIMQWIYPGRYTLQQTVQLSMYVPTLLFYIYLGLIKREFKVFPKTLDLFPPIASMVNAVYVFTGHAEYYNHWGSTWLGFIFLFIVLFGIFIERPVMLEIFKEHYPQKIVEREYILPFAKRMTWHIVVIFIIGSIAGLIYGFNANYLNSDSNKAKTLNVTFNLITFGVIMLYVRFFIVQDAKSIDKYRAKYGYVSKQEEIEMERDGLDITDKAAHTEFLKRKNETVLVQP